MSDMTAPTSNLSVSLPSKERLSYQQRKRLLRWAIAIFFVIYAIITLFPFYALFIRTFVSTVDSTELHLWIPPAREFNPNVQIGDLATTFSLDLKQFKQDMGLPVSVFLMPTATLKEISEENNIPLERIENYFSGFYTYNGWMTVLKSPALRQALISTLVVTGLSLLGLNILSILTGYGLAGLRRRDQTFIYNLYIFQLFIPPLLVLIPQFILVQGIMRLIPGTLEPGTERTISQFLSLILIHVRGGALTTMVFTAFISSIPRELEESAEIDGASRFQYLRYILLPLLQVPVATITVIMLPLLWNQYLEPIIFLDQQYQMIAPMVSSFAGAQTTNYQVIYTAVFVSILPLVLLYLVFRRQFIQGALAGAIKG